MKVEDVMTTEVWTVRSETPLKQAAEILAARHISGLPVVDEENRVVGVLSEGDVLFKERGAAEPRGLLASLLELGLPDVESKLAARTAGEAMTAPAVTIGPKRPLAEAAGRMIEEGINRLPVVDETGKLLGLVTRADLVRAFVRSDAEIEREIRQDVIMRTLWIAPETIEVVVTRGEVYLSGTVDTKADAELIPAFVQRVPGVVSVLSKIKWHEENGRNRSSRRLLWHKQP